MTSIDKRKFLSLLGISIALMLVVATGLWLVEARSEGGVGIHVALDQLPDGLNPVLRQNGTGIMVNDLIWNGLFKMGGEEDLASGATMVSDNNRWWEVELKEISWHDGRALDSHDVVFSVEAYLETSNQSPWKDYIDNYLESVEPTGPKRVLFKFRQPLPEFRLRAFLTFPIIPSQLNGTPLSTNLTSGERERTLTVRPIGTGPFVFKKWDIGRHLVFSANPRFHGGVPAVRAIVVHQVFDPVQRKKGWESGKYQIVPVQDPLELNGSGTSTTIVKWNPRSFYTVLFNTRESTLAHIGTRARLASAVDAKAILKTLSLDFPVNQGIFPLDLFERTLADYSVLPFVSQIASSSLPPPKRIVLLVSEEQRAFGERVGQEIVRSWEALGVDASIRVLRQDTLLQVLANGDYQAALMDLRGFDSIYSDLKEYFSSTGKWNWTGVHDAELNRLLGKLNRESDLNIWLPTARLLQKRMDALVIALPLFTAPAGALVKGVAGFSPDGDRLFLGAETWRGGRQ